MAPFLLLNFALIMATIVFITDMEEGHLFPTFGFAKKIVDEGHRLCYVGLCDNKKIVTDYGFEFKSVLEKEFPKGHREVCNTQDQASIAPLDMIDMITGSEFDNFYKEICPDLVLISTSLSLEALMISYEYAIEPIIFTPYFFSEFTPANEALLKLTTLPIKRLVDFFSFLSSVKGAISLDKNVSDFINQLNEFTEVIACSSHWEIEGHTRHNSNRKVYLGPCIRANVP